MVLPRAERRREADQGLRRVLERREGRIVAGDLAADPFLRRAVELARRGVGNTAPNPSVGAVLVRDGVTIGEGFHHVRGGPHAEVEALRDAARRGHDARGATAYVTLEPCNHTGLTPPCSEALVTAGVARVVVGALDPNPRTAGGGVARLRDAGIDVSVAGDGEALALIESFAVAIASKRPYVHLKMAASLDGKLAPEPGRYWLTGDAAREHVRALRASYDGVFIGIGTLRDDDPQLTLRPPHARLRPYHRVVVCGSSPPSRSRRIFGAETGYARTILLVPEAAAAEYGPLSEVAEVLAIPCQSGERIDLAAALALLKSRAIESLLCEGGAHLAASLLAARLVDRVDWLVAPRFLSTDSAVPALAGADLRTHPAFHFDRVVPLGDDLLLSARMGGVAPCSAD